LTVVVHFGSMKQTSRRVDLLLVVLLVGNFRFYVNGIRADADQQASNEISFPFTSSNNDNDGDDDNSNTDLARTSSDYFSYPTNTEYLQPNSISLQRTLTSGPGPVSRPQTSPSSSTSPLRYVGPGKRQSAMKYIGLGRRSSSLPSTSLYSDYFVSLPSGRSSSAMRYIGLGKRAVQSVGEGGSSGGQDLDVSLDKRRSAMSYIGLGRRSAMRYIGLGKRTVDEFASLGPADRELSLDLPEASSTSSATSSASQYHHSLAKRQSYSGSRRVPLHW
jgi:hypothetical protein